MTHTFDTLKLEHRDGLLEIVLNRPDVRNAMSHEMLRELDEALDQAEIDPDVQAVVLRGEGRLFSAGHDLKEHNAGRPFHLETFPHARPSIPPSFPRAWYFRKPLIGAVHGYVGPYALAIVACCDFNIAATDTRFSCEVFQGAHPDTPWLPLYVQLPMRVIEKLWLVGGWMDADQALQFQLVQRVVPVGAVSDEARRWAHHAARAPADQFARSKDKIRRSIEVLGLNLLSSILDPERSDQVDDGRASELADAIAEKGIQETMRARYADIDPTLTQV